MLQSISILEFSFTLILSALYGNHLNLSAAMAVNFLLMLHRRKILSLSPRGNMGSEKPGLVKDAPPHGSLLQPKSFYDSMIL